MHVTSVSFYFIFSIFYGLIIGRNRETLKSLEYQTKTRIKIPGQKEKNIISKYSKYITEHLVSIRYLKGDIFSQFQL